jgi:tRNA G18 (ribose-2'-O)-methylase SpoU
MRGYYGIGIAGGKTASNVGTLWRSAYQLGAAFIFTAGARYPRQASDTVKAWRHVPLFEYSDLETFLGNRPHDCMLIGIEMGGSPLAEFVHPERCIYMLGAEDHGLSSLAISKCQRIVSLPYVRMESYNVAVAGSLVMYDRLSKERER